MGNVLHLLLYRYLFSNKFLRRAKVVWFEFLTEMKKLLLVIDSICCSDNCIGILYVMIAVIYILSGVRRWGLLYILRLTFLSIRSISCLPPNTCLPQTFTYSRITSPFVTSDLRSPQTNSRCKNFTILQVKCFRKKFQTRKKWVRLL